MPYRVAFTPQARRQISQLQRYLASRFYPESTAHFIARLVDACESLKDGPFRGALRTDIGPNIRAFGFERRVTIYFTVLGDQVAILRISYRGQIPDIPKPTR